MPPKRITKKKVGRNPKPKEPSKSHLDFLPDAATLKRKADEFLDEVKESDMALTAPSNKSRRVLKARKNPPGNQKPIGRQPKRSLRLSSPIGSPPSSPTDDDIFKVVGKKLHLIHRYVDLDLALSMRNNEKLDGMDDKIDEINEELSDTNMQVRNEASGSITRQEEILGQLTDLETQMMNIPDPITDRIEKLEEDLRSRIDTHFKGLRDMISDRLNQIDEKLNELAPPR